MDNQQELEQKNITIAGIEDKGWGISLIDEKGLKYNVSKFLKGTQNETKAFQVLKGLPGYGMGMQKCVKFATVPNQQGGQSRYVRIIGELEQPQVNQTYATPPVYTNTAFKTPTVANLAPKAIINSQSDEIRSNVALKMVSEILAAGVVPISEWQTWADAFYNYKPNQTHEIIKKLQEAGLTKQMTEDEEIANAVQNIPF
jgi:hypothetical protein